MTKTKTNEQIFADIRERGMMTEQEMNLLKRRFNADGKDSMDYSLNDELGDGYGIPLTAEQGAKGLRWLQREAHKRNTVCGYREIDIIDNAEPTDFMFKQFRDASRWGDFPWFVPVFSLNGMEYYVDSDGLQIVG